MDFFSFAKLAAYQRAMELVVDVYAALNSFPDEERYALCDQLRRAVVSIPSNIAEGLTRFSNKEKAHFLEIAYGSLMETYCQLEVAKRLNYITEDEFLVFQGKIDETAKPITGLRNKALNSPPQP